MRQPRIVCRIEQRSRRSDRSREGGAKIGFGSKLPGTGRAGAESERDTAYFVFRPAPVDVESHFALTASRMGLVQLLATNERARWTYEFRR